MRAIGFEEYIVDFSLDGVSPEHRYRFKRVLKLSLEVMVQVKFTAYDCELY
jgi:hypothetical protein